MKGETRGSKVFLGIVLTLVLFYPQLLSPGGIGVVIAWVYGILFARLITAGLQYAIMHWGVNRSGMMVVGATLALFGLSVMYYAWQEGWWLVLGFGWVVAYAGGQGALSAYEKKIGDVYWHLFTTMQYLVVAFMVMVLTGDYLPQTPLGQVGIEYQGLSGESLVVLALVITVCEIVHHLGMRVQGWIEKTINR